MTLYTYDSKTPTKSRFNGNQQQHHKRLQKNTSKQQQQQRRRRKLRRLTKSNTKAKKAMKNSIRTHKRRAKRKPKIITLFCTAYVILDSVCPWRAPGSRVLTFDFYCFRQNFCSFAIILKLSSANCVCSFDFRRVQYLLVNCICQTL